MKKNDYQKPSFLAAPIAVICSKMGCPVREVSFMDQAAFAEIKELGSTAVPVLPEDFNTRADQDRLFIFEPTLQHVFSLNETGACIVKAINGKRSVQEIAKQVSKTFSNAPAEIDYEVSSFINSLRNAGLKIDLK